MTKERVRRDDKRDRVLLAVAASVCIAVPLFARSALDHRVHVELAGAASELLGVPVELGDTRVGLTGTLEIRDVRVGDSLRAARVIAAVSPARVGDGGLSANEILVDSPTAHLIVQPDGSTNLDSLWKRHRNRSSAARSSTSSTSSRLERVRVVNGRVDVEVVGRGQVVAEGVAVQMHGDNVHAVVGKSEVRLRQGDFEFAGVMPRAALDYQRHGGGLLRFLADGGAFKLSGPDGRAVLQELVIANADGDSGWRVQARSGIDRPTGHIALDLRQELGGAELTIEADGAPLFLAAPWLPAGVMARDSQVSGTLAVSIASAITAVARLSVTDLRLDEEALARRPLDLDVTIDATVSLRKDKQVYLASLDLRSLASGELTLTGSASGQFRIGSYVPDLGKLELHLGNIGCDAALSALPAALRPSLAGLELRGQMHSDLDIFVSRQNRDDTALRVSSGLEGCRAVREPPAADTESLLADYEHRSPDGRPHLLVKGTPGFTAYEELPSFVPKAFVAAEDARFFEHEGFDTHQIERSLAIDVQTGRFLRGGSTISQQLVKNLFLHRKRTLARKLQEAILTWRLEKNVGKERILEVYLNIIELGDDHTYGITEASQRWFGIAPADLSIAQTAFLAALTPEPGSMSARIRHARGLDEVSAARVATILRVMRRSGVITSAEYRKAHASRLRFASSALAWRAPGTGR